MFTDLPTEILIKILSQTNTSVFQICKRFAIIGTAVMKLKLQQWFLPLTNEEYQLIKKYFHSYQIMKNTPYIGSDYPEKLFEKTKEVKIVGDCIYLDRLTNLTFLDCSWSKVRAIPETLVNLITLDISHTWIEKIPILPKLKNLDCSNNTIIKEIPKELNLEILHCDNAYYIKSIPTFTNLKSLRFSKTGVESIPEFPKLKRLQCTFDKKITELNPNMTNLNSLLCYETKISWIPATYINLIKLSCHNTNVTELPDTLINLIELECDYTSISEIPKTYINLVHLSCMSTLITEIPETLINLKKLCADNIKIPQNLKYCAIIN